MEERFETFTVLITRISRSIKRIKADEMADFELKGPHVSCLYYLSQQDGMTAPSSASAATRTRRLSPARWTTSRKTVTSPAQAARASAIRAHCA